MIKLSLLMCVLYTGFEGLYFDSQDCFFCPLAFVGCLIWEVIWIYVIFKGCEKGVDK